MNATDKEAIRPLGKKRGEMVGKTISKLHLCYLKFTLVKETAIGLRS